MNSKRVLVLHLDQGGREKTTSQSVVITELGKKAYEIGG